MSAVLEPPAEPAMPLTKTTQNVTGLGLPLPQRIVLTGFMGSGKSTVGRLLAEKLSWDFIDLDTVIEARTGKRVADIFSERGEDAFRREETAALASVLRRTQAVIALGGGAPETLGNRLILEQTPFTAIVFLEAAFTQLEARCHAQASGPDPLLRPNFADREAARVRFEKRQPMYRRLADITIDAGFQTAQQAVIEIAARLRGLKE